LRDRIETLKQEKPMGSHHHVQTLLLLFAVAPLLANCTSTPSGWAGGNTAGTTGGGGGGGAAGNAAGGAVGGGGVGGSTVDPWSDYLSTSRNTAPDWAHTLRRGFSVDRLPGLLAQGDLIATVNGPQDFEPSLGFGGAALAAYIQSLQQGGLARYQAAIYEAALDAVALEQTTGNTVYWLLGNEINSRSKSSSWEPYADGTQTGEANDPSYIPAFAEYEMAPIVESLLRAEADAGADIRLMLGSIANGSGRSQRAWASTLLDYTFVGTYAPSLAGRKVSEFMEYLAFHYSIIDSNWEDTLDYYSAKPGIRGVFDTEEIGNQAMAAGVGPYQALLGFSRVMHWAAKHDRGAAQVRINYWSEGQAFAGEAMTLLHGFLGDVTVTELNAPTVTATGTTEAYAFEANGKRVLLVFAGRDAGATLTQVHLAVADQAADMSGTLHVFVPDAASNGLTSAPVSPVLDASGVAINTKVALPANGVAMFFLP
jgi:hypothetical protein